MKDIDLGNVKIYGEFLDQLDKLKAGEVLTLTDTNGRKFAVLLWEDLTSRVDLGS